MDAISNLLIDPAARGIEAKSRSEPKLKPFVDRVRANPFYPEGRISKATDSPKQVFESNLPGQSPLESRKVGTVLNTVA